MASLIEHHDPFPTPGAARPRRLIERFRNAMRVRGYSQSTGEAYWHWIRTFIHFHGTRHPGEMREPEVAAFLAFLAAERKASAAEQHQALAALGFLYREVLGQALRVEHRRERPLHFA